MISESDECSSLEEIIALARKGRDLKARVSIKTSESCPKLKRASLGDDQLIIESYSLIRDFVFRTETEERTISKTSLLGYFFGTEEELPAARKLICEAANDHLRNEYQCLKAAQVQVDEAFVHC